jgi:protein TonB
MLIGVAVPRLLMGKLQLACLLLPILFATPCWSQSDPAGEWRREIAAQIQASVHFPSTIHQGGEARVAFTLDRSGRVTSTKLIRSSGLLELDQAALAAIENAHFPSAPPEVDDSGLNFVAPMVFVPGKHEHDEKMKARLQGICRGC